MEKFPEFVYAHLHLGDEEVDFPCAEDRFNFVTDEHYGGWGWCDGEEVAVYRLVGTKKIKASVCLVDAE
jgi:hypothetical protein